MPSDRWTPEMALSGSPCIFTGVDSRPATEMYLAISFPSGWSDDIINTADQ